MTFQEAIDSLKVTVDRPDLEATFPDQLNQAVREAADRHDWDQLKKTGTTAITIGNSIGTLPEDFKAWQNGRFCAAEAGVPVPVYTRTELERLVPLFRPTTHLTFTQDNDAKQIALPAAVLGTNRTFSLYYFGYPVEVVNMSLTTPLLRDYPQMILARARANIFKDINDPVYTVHEGQFEKEVAIATSDDVSDSNPAPDPEKE